ncbi:hypothetical protein [Lactococcus lactis]|uniref:Single-stranded DNA-binding protein n=1 Tax=Lactococcus lactis TaxID=1358 RepID=A0AAP4DT34_9LACT|nr:hypothetical protein [Lactococcus lactis]MDG4975124.1 single-stranded DNA-binding protein [Lactococcus lactis]
MGYKVQFTVSNSEKIILDKEAITNGFPNISELCKHRSLQGKSTYAELYKEMLTKINKLKSGERFILRDLIDTPPALLGKWLFDNVDNGTISDVKHLGNNRSDVEEYEKI